jgi:hypothetical protein
MTALRVRGVVSVGEREALGRTEVGLNEIQPGGVRRRVDRVNPQAPEEAEKAGVVVHVREVIQDHVEGPPWIASPEATKRRTEFDDALAFGKAAAQAVGVDIIEAEKVFDALRPMIRGADPFRPASPGPRQAANRSDFERPPFIKTDYGRARRTPPVERADAVFF